MKRESIVAVLPTRIREGGTIGNLRRPDVVIPDVPGDVVVEADGWCTVYPHGRERPGVMAHVRDQGGGAYVVIGEDEAVTTIAAKAERMWSGLDELRTDASPAAEAVKAAWPDDRPREMVLVKGRLEPIGEKIGERVALRSAMAGFHEDDGERAVIETEVAPVLDGKV